MSKFSPTPAELALVAQIFNQADPQKLGILTGDVAVKVFGGAKLQPSVLGEIWSIADEDNNGWLPRKGVAIALRLIAWAQKGEKITPELVSKPGPLPDIEGYSAIPQNTTGTPLAKSPPPTVPVLTAQEKTKFMNLFNKAGPDANGLLSGNKARDIFVKSKLGNDTLLQIWNLADTQDRGALDSTDFAIGMYFIQALMSGHLTFVPTILPPGLYQQAGGGSANNHGSVRSHMTGNSGSFSPLNTAFPQSRTALQPQYTGQSQHLQPNHTGFSVTSSKPPALPARPTAPTTATPPFVPQRNGHAPHWDVTADEKATADTYFNDLDAQRRGYIEGDVAVPFLLKSNLPGEELAHVWDLADINNDGRLTRDGFAVAMHLIQKKLAGNDIPSSLPPTLIPPSLRGTTVASPFAPPPQQQAIQEPARDLLWDDTPPASATVPVSRPSEAPQPQHRSVSAPAPADRDPFGTSIFHSTTSPSNHDLLGDDDEAPTHASPPLQDRSAEIGNTQNQINSTNRALDTLKNERAQSDERLANQTSQLESLQTQLATAKAAYEMETKTLANIRERFKAQAADLQKVTEELIRAESDLSAVRVEKAEIEGAYMRDKEDTRELQRKMVEVGQLIDATKTEVEKAKKDAKQQKGLLAIAKKQLSSKEAERAKAEKELEEAAAEVAAITTEHNDTESALAAFASAPPSAPVRADSATFAANHPLPSSPDRGSPAPSTTGKSNNPFDKLNKSGGTPRSQSPFLPFAAGPLPTPSTGDSTSITNAVNRASSYDPFGFSEAFETDAPTISNGVAPLQGDLQAASRTFTPKPAHVDISDADVRQSLFSPGTEGESDHFVTPPTTATAQPSLTSSPAPAADSAAKFPVLDDVTTAFPDLEAPSSTANHHTNEETDLGSKLQELDVEESDSDAEDEVPLADLAAKARASPKSSPTLTTDVAPASTEVPSFDDVFGVTPPSAEQPQFGAPSTTHSQTVAKAEPSAIAGVSVFDEAMGTIPPSAASSKQAFTFDTAFDDNFDFDSATNRPFPPPPKSATIANGSGSQGFDSIFTTPAKDSTPIFAPPPGPPPSSSISNDRTARGSPSVPTSKPTFDEAFSGFDSGPSLNLDSSYATPAPKPATTSQVTSFPSAAPASPPRRGAASPPVSARPKSPPPRTASPKPPRPSTSSSKETHEKTKEPPTRHSKLSVSNQSMPMVEIEVLIICLFVSQIRLPFGKKKKQQQAEPLPPSPAQHLTPPREEPTRTVTPAGDDDVEAVKQLSAMGFSRSQAIDALEKYGYDVQRALNSLLGAP
ncbi:hypothetical protein H0H87_006063 [Tephrocybe sp. NHM501043]|nr:hypothetical protein H0H87_006063 [Tephrocybe sp. NHM501043]